MIGPTPLILLATQLALPGPRPIRRLHRLHPSTRQRRGFTPVVLLLGVLAVVLTGRLSLVLAAVVILATAGRVARAVRQAAATRRREAQAATFLGHLAGELRAGNGMAAAVDHAAAALPDDAPRVLGDLLRQVSGLTRQGRSAAGLLKEGPPELRALGTLWELSDRHGLPLVPLVEQAQQRLDARLRHHAATRATLQGPQATAVILTLLPLAGIAMGTAMGADPVGLLTGGGLGGGLLVTGTTLAAGGFLWSRHIIGQATT